MRQGRSAGYPGVRDGTFVTRRLELPDFEFGFTAAFDEANARSLTATLGEDAAVDPGPDERIANEVCPSCGRRFAELPVDHAWSLDLCTRDYTCSDPVIPGEVLARKDQPR